MKRVAMLLVSTTLTVAMIGPLAPHAGATSAGAGAVVCNGLATFSPFSPRLGVLFGSGSVTESLAPGWTCVTQFAEVDTATFPPANQGTVVFVNPFGSSSSHGWAGNCQFASLGIGFWPGSGVIIGGSVVLENPITIGVSAFSAVYALVPDSPCNERTATGTGVVFGAFDL